MRWQEGAIPKPPPQAALSGGLPGPHGGELFLLLATYELSYLLWNGVYL